MFIKIGNYYLDNQQKEIVLDDSNYLLVVASAGSGKTLTILGKINYLVNNKKIKPNQIICLSFTNAASNSLKEKIKKELNIDIPVYTFHKLGLRILKNKYQIADINTLDYIIDEMFTEGNKYIYKYLKVKNKLEYLKIINGKEVKNFKTLLITFIHLFKCNNYELKDFNNFLKRAKKIFNFNYKKEKVFLIIALNIYIKYQKYLKDNNEIDFDDMLIKAKKQVDKYYNEDIKYIIIDEYQDTSLIRFNLIRSIINQTNSKLMVVGDDFQSIYRFTGCDIKLFIDFKNYFKDSKILKIENTYRNSLELIKIAGLFVMKNKKQIKKNLKSDIHLEDPIKIITYKDRKKDFKKLLRKIYKENSTLLVLGRNNNDINNYLDDYKISNDLIEMDNIKFKYMTIHKSKGLESDNVIIINLVDDLLGMPCKIKDDKVLRFVTNYEKYPFSEERRLFYVALTRTKNNVYLFCPNKNKSIFVEELIKNYKIKTYKIDKLC